MAALSQVVDVLETLYPLRYADLYKIAEKGIKKI